MNNPPYCPLPLGILRLKQAVVLYVFLRISQLFQKEKLVAVCQTNFSRNHAGDFFFLRKKRLFDFFLGIDIQQLQLFPTLRWYCFVKLPATMSQTANKQYVIYFIVSLVAVALQHTMKTFEELLCILACTSCLIII